MRVPTHILVIITQDKPNQIIIPIVCVNHYKTLHHLPLISKQKYWSLHFMCHLRLWLNNISHTTATLSSVRLSSSQNREGLHQEPQNGWWCIVFSNKPVPVQQYHHSVDGRVERWLLSIQKPISWQTGQEIFTNFYLKEGFRLFIQETWLNKANIFKENKCLP